MVDFSEWSREQLIPKVEPKKWMADKHMELVTIDTLDRVIDECIASGRCSLDLETTGLNKNTYSTKISGARTKDAIVGYCLSPDGVKGYYIPVRHRKGEEHNLSVTKVEAAMRRLVDSDTVIIFHNAKFDQEFLQFAGGQPIGMWDDPRKWDDTLILAYLRNSREKNKGLKALSKNELGFEMIELKELFPDDHKGDMDFSELDPSWEAVLWYAASDAICTYCLYEVLAPVILNGTKERAKQDQIYLLEKLCLPATRWMERVGIPTNQDKVTELIRLGQEEYYACLEDVYQFCENALGRDVAPGWFQVFREKKNLANADYNINQQIEDARLEARRKLLDSKDEKGHYVKVSVEKDGETKEWPEKYDILSRPQLGPLFEELEIPDLKRTDKSGQVQTTQSEIERLNEWHGDKYPFLPKIKRMGELQKALGTYLISLRRDVGPDGCLHPTYNQLGTDTGRFTTPSSKNPEQDGGTKFPVHGTPATYDKSRPECLLRIREAFTTRSSDFILAACFAEGSLVSTARGLVPVEEVTPQDRVLTETGYKQVNWSGYTGTKPTVTVQTSKGFQLRVTPDHRILVAGEDGFEWKEAGNLEEGDWVCQVTGGSQSDETTVRLPDTPWSESPVARAQEVRYALRTPRAMSQELALFLGRFLGDGPISHDKGEMVSVNMALGLDVDSVLPELNRISKELFDREFTRCAKGDVRINSRPLCRWLNSITNKADSSVHDLEIPEIVLRSGPQITAAFLRGLFDADGSVSKRSGDGVRIWISSNKMAQQTQLLLLQHGIQAKRVWATRTTNFGHTKGWDLTITGIRNLERFQDRVGMASVRKNQILNELVKVGRNRDMSEFIPLGLAKKAVIRQRHAETNRIHSNGKRKGRVSRELLQNALKRPDDVDPKWMELLLDGPLVFDTVEAIWDSGEARVYDVSVPDGNRLQVSGVVAHNCDFGGVELRIATNYSREPKWTIEYFRCSKCDYRFDSGDGSSTPEAPPAYCPRCGSDKIGDLHSATAIAFYGQDKVGTKEFKGLRQNAKGANFALAYGGGPSALMRATGCDENEAARHHRTFNQTYSTLKGWWDDIKGFARRYAYVPTAFGRQYPLPDIKLPISPKDEPDDFKRRMNKKFRAKAERNATNGPVQGLSADLTKLAMGLIYKEVKKREWFDKVFMLITIHDELVFEVHKSIAAEALEVFQQIMTRSPAILKQKWPVPLTTDCEIGYDWTAPYDTKDFKYRLVRRDGMQMDPESKSETGKVWPKDLVDVFGPYYGYFDDEEAAKPEPSTVSEEPSPTPVAPSVPETKAPRLVDGEPYEYRLRNWGLGTAEKLAHVIVECAGRGSHPLTVLSPSGDLALWDGAKIMVNPIEFEATAKAHKL